MGDGAKTKEQLIADLKELRQKIAELESRHHYPFYLDDLPIGINNVDVLGNFTYVNKRFLEISGYSKEEIIGKNGLKIGLFPPDSLKLIAKRMRDRLAGKPSRYLKLQFRCKDSRLIWVEIEGRLIKEHGVPVGFQITSRDITEHTNIEESLRKAHKELQVSATHDLLTGLPNRTLLYDRFDIAQANAQRNNKKLSIMSLDLDRFKTVNDTFGHDIGDKVLTAAAVRLTNSLRKVDTVARFGGDEFVVLLWDINQKENAVKVAQKIVVDFRQPFLAEERSLSVSISIGVTLYPEHGKNIEVLLKKSDEALYRVKKSGRDNFRLSSDDMQEGSL